MAGSNDRKQLFGNNLSFSPRNRAAYLKFGADLPAVALAKADAMVQPQVFIPPIPAQNPPDTGSHFFFTWLTPPLVKFHWAARVATFVRGVKPIGGRAGFLRSKSNANNDPSQTRT